MSKIRVKRISSGVRELLKSKEIAAVCEGKASKVLQAAGESKGYKLEKRSYTERTGFAVYPASIHARRDNLKHNTLEKAVRQR